MKSRGAGAHFPASAPDARWPCSMSISTYAASTPAPRSPASPRAPGLGGNTRPVMSASVRVHRLRGESPTGGRITSSRTECREGEASGRRNPLPGVTARGVRAFILPLRAVERDGKQNRREAREAGSWRQDVARQCRQGYTRNRRPWRSSRAVVGGSLDLNRPHGVGAGQRRQSMPRGRQPGPDGRQVVQPER